MLTRLNICVGYSKNSATFSERNKQAVCAIVFYTLYIIWYAAISAELLDKFLMMFF